MVCTWIREIKLYPTEYGVQSLFVISCQDTFCRNPLASCSDLKSEWRDKDGARDLTSTSNHSTRCGQATNQLLKALAQARQTCRCHVPYSSYPSSSGCQEYEEKSWCNADGSYGSGTAGGNIGRRLLDTCVRVPFSIKMDKQTQGDLLVKTMNWQDYQIDRENLYWVSLEGKRGNERTKKIMAPCHGSEFPKFRWAAKLPCSQVGGHLGEPSVTTALEALMFPPFVVAWLNSSLSLQHIPAPPWLHSFQTPTDGCELRVASEVRVEEVCVAHRQLLSQPATKILLQ